MAADKMGCHSATISHIVLDELAKLKHDSSKQPGEGLPKTVQYYRDIRPTLETSKKLSTIDPLAAADGDGKLLPAPISTIWLTAGPSWRKP